MSTYLDLVNKVVDESASEQDQLTAGTWASAVAGRRVYSRIKRNVADAWKKIQLMRDQWTFMTDRYSGTVYPRVTIKSGTRAAGAPAVGAIYGTPNSRFELTIRSVVTTGSWTAGTAEGYIEYDDYDGATIMPDDVFTEIFPTPAAGTFVYVSRGNYDFSEQIANLRSVQWETFAAASLDHFSIPMHFTPWDNWLHNDGQGMTGSSAPAFVSQDYQGLVTFYPSTFEPFKISFVYKTSPQILSAYADIPTGIPAEYHDWVVWEALKMFAKFDKNPVLYAYAESEAVPYKLRAEKNLMPLMSYRQNSFNV